MYNPALQVQELKVKSGRFMKKMKVERKGERLFFTFGFDRNLMNEVKNMGKPKWHGFDDVPLKKWSVRDDSRTRFCLDFLMGNHPYDPWTKPLIDITPRKYPGIDRPYDHQLLIARRILTSHYCIIAGEMGTGKTLGTIIAAEETKIPGNDIWFVGPRNACKVFNRELRKWRAHFQPRHVITYERLVSIMKNWKDGDPAPRFVIFDESSRVKTQNAQRSQAAFHLAEAVRAEHGVDGYVIELSGTPAPKTPVDWWHQCEIACPGFLSENHPSKLKKRLCLEEERETPMGVVFPKLITWWDDENKCKHCGQIPSSTDDLAFACGSTCDCGNYEPSVNEVAKLHKRMDGLVTVLFKKDCLDLPEKTYQILKVKPTKDMLQAVRLIKDSESSAIKVINAMKQLSDGFLYADREVGKETCHHCHGKCEVDMPHIIDPDGSFEDPDNVSWVKEKCPTCAGSGKVTSYERYTEFIGSPKIAAMIDDMKQVEDVGRAVVWCGYTGSIDTVSDALLQAGWAVLRIDGKSWGGTLPSGEAVNADTFIAAMDASDANYKELREKYPKICVVGNAKSGGMAFSFTSAPVAWYYSNSNDGEARTQSEDRIHRPGMSLNRGATIVDVICLPCDLMVLNSNKAKRRLETMSMGELETQLDKAVKELGQDGEE